LPGKAHQQGKGLPPLARSSSAQKECGLALNRASATPFLIEWDEAFLRAPFKVFEERAKSVPETLAQLFDPGALAIVLAGTLIATTARCGWRDLSIAARAVTQLGRSEFDKDANRAALAKTVAAIQRAGLLGADAPSPPDRALAAQIDALLRSGSFDALHAIRRADRAAREGNRASAIRVFEYAGELAPVFGLVGTLFAITQLAPAASADPTEATLAAVATAVLSSLYGVLTAHFLCIPTARAIERKGEREEAARAQLIEWLETEAMAAPGGRITRLRDVAGARS